MGLSLVNCVAGMITSLEGARTCMQSDVSTHRYGADLVSKLSVSIRGVPLVAVVNGTLMAR
jgi:hypothetical protein